MSDSPASEPPSEECAESIAESPAEASDLEVQQALLDYLYSNSGLQGDFYVAAGKFLKSAGTSAADVARITSMNDMLEAMLASEFYSADYASKEQPHAQGLLHTLHDSMVLHASGPNASTRQRLRGP